MGLLARGLAWRLVPEACSGCGLQECGGRHASHMVLRVGVWWVIGYLSFFSPLPDVTSFGVESRSRGCSLSTKYSGSVVASVGGCVMPAGDQMLSVLET